MITSLCILDVAATKRIVGESMYAPQVVNRLAAGQPLTAPAVRPET
jgi:hypothetical protein